jgi:hypothetical protein
VHAWAAYIAADIRSFVDAMEDDSAERIVTGQVARVYSYYIQYAANQQGLNVPKV